MPTLLQVKKFFKKFWGLLAGLGLAIVYLLVKYKKKPEDVAAGVRESGKQLINDVEAARAAERDAADAEAVRHAAQMEAIKQKYDQERDRLDAATTAEAERIFKEYGDDPVALAEELSIATGFKVVLPKD
jgi:acyl-CoA reductase-like NAD-dependent aldehyde dehydrogenase